MVRKLTMAAVLMLPMAAMAQNGTSGRPPATTGGVGVSGQQNGQPIPSQFQSQMQTDNSQQPPQVRVLPATPDAQTQPNPLPQLSR